MTLAERRRELMTDALADLLEDSQEAADTKAIAKALWAAYRHLAPTIHDLDTRERQYHGLRLLGAKMPASWALSLLGATLGCGEAAESLGAYASQLRDLGRLGLVIRQHEQRWDKARTKAEGLACCELCDLYAGYLTWADDAELDTYLDALSDYEACKWELIIETPVKLVLALSDSGFLALLKLPLLATRNDDTQTGDLTSLAMALRARLCAVWQGGVLNDAYKMVGWASGEYQHKYCERLHRLRCLAQTRQARLRWCQALERGEFREPAKT